jgi:hypothetical protein
LSIVKLAVQKIQRNKSSFSPGIKSQFKTF